MAPELPSARIYSKGRVSLVIAIFVVAVVLIFFPAYRVFFAVSVGLGLVFAGLIYLRNKYSPVKEPETNNKRPLGL
jgi:hypothetical protein